MVQSGGTGTFLNFLDESQEMRNRLAFFSVLWLIYWILGGRKWYRIQENTDSLLINCGNVRKNPAKCQQLQLNTAYQWNKDATWNHINSADSNSTTKVTIIPRCFPGVSQKFPGAIFFSFALLKIPTSFAKEVFFYLNLLLLWCFPSVSRVFPGCSRAQFFVLFYFVKNPHNFC